MPFAEVAGFVAAGVEEFGEGFELVADRGAGEGVVDDAVGLDVLAGEEAAAQRGVVTKAFRNWAPSRAMRSMLGVLRKGWPA